MPTQEPEPVNNADYFAKNEGALDQKRLTLQAKGGFNGPTKEFLESLSLPSGSTILELGPGPGEVTGILLGLGHHVIAADLNPEMLARVQTRYQNEGLSHHLETIAGDITELDLGGRQVDGIDARLFWTHIPKNAQPIVLERVLRHLKPGGLLIIEDLALSFEKTTWVLRPPSEAHKKLHTAFLKMYEANGLDPDTGLNMPDVLRSLGLTEVLVNDPYSIECTPDNPFINAYWMIYAVARDPMISRGGLSAEEFDQAMQEYKEDLMREGTVSVTPQMAQMAFRKPA